MIPLPADTDDLREGDWLEEAEARVLDAALRLAPERGWTARMAQAAVLEAGLNARDQRLVLPDGPRDLAALLAQRHDRRALAALATVDAAALKIRERIHTAVEARIEAAMRDEAGVRRANGFLALPFNAPLALRLAWRSADGLWRWAGDTATDENHYSKRAILSAVLISTLAARLRGGPEEGGRHLDQRIAQVMDFERWKAKLPKAAGSAETLAGWLGGLRYGARDPDPRYDDTATAAPPQALPAPAGVRGATAPLEAPEAG